MFMWFSINSWSLKHKYSLPKIHNLLFSLARYFPPTLYLLSSLCPPYLSRCSSTPPIVCLFSWSPNNLITTFPSQQDLDNEDYLHAITDIYHWDLLIVSTWWKRGTTGPCSTDWVYTPDNIVTSSSRDYIVTSSSRDYIVTSSSRDNIVTSSSRDYIVTSSSRDYIVTSFSRYIYLFPPWVSQWGQRSDSGISLLVLCVENNVVCRIWLNIIL